MAQKKTVYRIATTGEPLEVEGVIKSYTQLPNEQFGFRKDGRVWTVDHIRSGLKILDDTTQRKAEDRLLKLFENKEVITLILAQQDIETTMKRRKEGWERWNKLSKEFKQITNITLPVDPLLSAFNGYKTVDVVKLDEMIGTPDGVSTNDYLIEKFGKRANEIVDELLG